MNNNDLNYLQNYNSEFKDESKIFKNLIFTFPVSVVGTLYDLATARSSNKHNKKKNLMKQVNKKIHNFYL